MILRNFLKWLTHKTVYVIVNRYNSHSGVATIWEWENVENHTPEFKDWEWEGNTCIALRSLYSPSASVLLDCLSSRHSNSELWECSVHKSQVQRCKMSYFQDRLEVRNYPQPIEFVRVLASCAIPFHSD